MGREKKVVRTMPIKRAALYVRVSSREQKLYGISIDNQVDSLKEYAQENGMDIVNIYNDAGISARKKYTKRPALLQLINDIKKGLIDIVLFTKLDRWFRSVADYYEVQSVLDEYKVPWRAIWEDYETETTNGIFKVNIMLSVAQQEADRTSDRIKAVNAYRREHGEFMGSNPARGYIKVKGNKLEKDPDMEPWIQSFFDTYLSTFSPTKAMDAVAPKFKMTRTEVTRMLRNPSYKGDAYGCKCPAYITEEQYDKIIDSISGRRAKGPAKRTYLFSGMIVCPECGNYLVGRFNVQGKYKARYEYKMYHCPGNSVKRTCSYGVNVNEKILESYLLDSIDDIIQETNMIISESRKDMIDHEEEIKKLRARAKRLATLFEMGDIDDDEYKEKRRSIYNKISELEASETKLITPLPDGWENIYNELTDENKKSFWRSSIRKIHVYGKGNEKTYKLEF